MAKGYWVVLYREIRDPSAMPTYHELALPVVRSYGGRFLARGMPAEAHESGLVERTVLIEFNSLEQALAAHGCDAYKAALEALGDAADRDLRIIAGAG